MLDLSKLTKDMMCILWCHWSGQARANLPVLVFIKAKKQNLSISVRYNTEKTKPVLGKKTVAYVEPRSDDKANDSESERPPPSKHPHLSKEATISDNLSPAANCYTQTLYILQ